MRAWGRLGYPRRALRLHAAATAIVADHGGEVPADYDDLLALPGVGDYTAAAIASFAYGRRHVVLDTNVRRVFARAVSGVEFPAAAVTRAERDLATGLLPEDEPTAATWAVAVMELGALVCTADEPVAARAARSPTVRVARGRPPGVRRAGPQGADVRRHRPAVPRPAARPGPRQPTAPSPQHRLDAIWADPVAARAGTGQPARRRPAGPVGTSTTRRASRTTPCPDALEMR